MIAHTDTDTHIILFFFNIYTHTHIYIIYMRVCEIDYVVQILDLLGVRENPGGGLGGQGSPSLFGQ